MKTSLTAMAMLALLMQPALAQDRQPQALPPVAGMVPLPVGAQARPLTLAQCAAQDRDERAKWAEYVKIAKIEPQ